MALIRIEQEEFNKHRDSIVQRYQQLGFTQMEIREEKRGELLYCNLIGYKMDFDGTTESKSALFPLEKEVEVIENKAETKQENN